VSSDQSSSIQRDVTIKVPFHDADPAGIVWHGRYFKYFELARCELLEAIGYSYRQMAESGYLWPVVDLQVRFVRPLQFEQRIRVRARLDEWEYRLRISYVISDDSDNLIARGRTDQAPVSEATGELVLGCPEVLRQCVQQAHADAAKENGH